MQDFNNINTFVSNGQNIKKIPKEMYMLIIFTAYSRFNRNLLCQMPFVNITKGDSASQYKFNYKNKEFGFSLFSDFDLQPSDKKKLKSPKRIAESMYRTLKLACSMDLVNPRVTIGNSLVGNLDTLILFQADGMEKVIDYAMNIVMNKEDYYELFGFKELNVLDKYDLYRIYYITSKFNDFEHIYEYLIFSKEIFENFAKNEQFKFLTEKYDGLGTNKRNYTILGNDCDCLFFQPEDVYHMKYAKLIRELDSFTENPSKFTRHISYDSSQNKYKFNDRKFGFFTFDLLSDMISNEKVKNRLLSKSRNGNCHQNSDILGRALSDEDKICSYVVGGKFKENETDYLYHSWVEIDAKNVVIDFNHNIVMDRDKYYKLYEVVPISKTPVLEMEEIIQTIIHDAELGISSLGINYFGAEIVRDLNKNKELFKKSK